ncbi:hypothetical protein Hdeb2414_s0025g00658541 [Helianthus debilis subsp. tardiflorus]
MFQTKLHYIILFALYFVWRCNDDVIIEYDDVMLVQICNESRTRYKRKSKDEFTNTQHVQEALGQHFGTRHCSVSDAADSMLSHAEEVYDHLSLPVMELVIDALKHDDWSTRLKSILDPSETVELSDEERVGGDGDGYE